MVWLLRILNLKLIEKKGHKLLLNESVDNFLRLRLIIPKCFATIPSCTNLRHYPNKINTPGKEACIAEDDSVFTRDLSEKTIQSYCVELRTLILEKKLEDALGIHDKILCKDQRRLSRSVYNILIWGCGKYGYSKKAYELYTKMKESRIPPSNVTYTSLFNSFANSPYKSESLKLCDKVLRDVKKFDITLNQINYHAMIKAYGRCGNIVMAFDMVDEMMSKKIPLNSETVSFLLQGCLSQSKSGFILAIMVWWKMNQYRIPRIINHYNLLLNITKSCGAKKAENLPAFFNTHPTFSLPILSLSSQSNEAVDISKLTPELLQVDKANKFTTFSNFNTPIERYNALGGLDGLLTLMKNDGVKPDIKFFTNVLELVPNGDASENELLESMKQNSIYPDDVFLCMLMKKRCSYKNIEGAKDVLRLFNEFNVKVNVLVYGILATTCHTINDAKAYLESLAINEIRPNVQILGCLLNKACRSLDYKFIIYLMKQYKIHKVRPSELCLKSLEKAHKRGRQIELDIDNNVNVSDKLRWKVERTSYKHFMMSYHPWRRLAGKSEVDPWQQFSVESKNS